MGSVLFPLFHWIYDSMDSDREDEGGKTSSELAWRTVFVVPALIAIVTGISIIIYCDDSPLGSYRDLIKKERLVVVDPYESLCKAAWNRNVWVLAIQYACCLGVELTMTNATALYYKDEFGQTTVSAAAISSVFGMMNLFARGLGGWGSDWFQNVAGVRGRLAWQMTTLTLEGGMMCIFASMDTLGGSILALIGLSCMVQCAEGSTFGIVPYVDRRFTGMDGRCLAAPESQHVYLTHLCLVCVFLAPSHPKRIRGWNCGKWRDPGFGNFFHCLRQLFLQDCFCRHGSSGNC
jgi:MFS transporter, NNP family, nitrate/nitrite transporter